MACSHGHLDFIKGSVFLLSQDIFYLFLELAVVKTPYPGLRKKECTTSVLPIDSLYVSVIPQASSRSERWGYLSTQNTPIDLHSHYFADRCCPVRLSWNGSANPTAAIQFSGDAPACWVMMVWSKIAK